MDLQREGRFNRRAVLVGEAQRRVLAAVRPLAAETAPLWTCGGRFLAEPYAATADWPPFARSGMDGYAVRAADVAHATPAQPAVLRVIGAVAAGELAEAPVTPGTAVRIMTGAAVPEGADAVVMLEQTADAPGASGQEPAVLVKQPAAPGRHIAPRGEEFRRGDAVAGPGERLRPGHIALLGSFGYAELRVHRRPRVAVIATGAELLPVEAPLAPGRIRDSNSAMVAALIASCGAEPLLLDRLADDPDAAEAAVAAALREADAVVTTGGVSVGDYDAMAVLIRRLREKSGGTVRSVDAQAALDAQHAQDVQRAQHVQAAAQHAQAAQVAQHAQAAQVAQHAQAAQVAQHAQASQASRYTDVPSASGLPFDDCAGSGESYVLFDKVAMRPGSPTSAALIGGKPLFALSGNPGACHVGFELFVRPALRKMAGCRSPLPRVVKAELAEPIGQSSPHEQFVRAKLEERDGRLFAIPLAFAKSSMMASLPHADALLRIPAGPAGAARGQLVEAMPLAES